MLIATILPYVQIILSLLLIGAVLLQQSSAGMGGAFGGGDDTSTHYTKRGLEKTFFNITIIIAILFTISAFLALII